MNHRILKTSDFFCRLFKDGNYRPAPANLKQAYKGVGKYDFQNPPLDPILFNLARKEYVSILWRHFSHGCSTIEEVISTRPRGSAGITHPGVRKIEILDHPFGAYLCEQLIALGNDCPVDASSFCKDEVRKSDKDTRQVNAMIFWLWLVETITDNKLEESLSENPIFAMGSTPFYGGWHSLMQRLSRPGFDQAAASDVGKMDSHMHKAFIEMDNGISQSIHSETCKSCWRLHDHYLPNVLKTKVVLPDGHVYEKQQGHNSGGRCTCGRNSRYMLWLLIYGKYYAGVTAPLLDVIQPLIFGDDIILTSSLPYETLDCIYEGIRSVGHEVALEYGAVDNLPFLSFCTRWDNGVRYPVPHDRERFAAHVVCGMHDSNEGLMTDRLNMLRLLCYNDPELLSEMNTLMGALDLPVVPSVVLDSIWKRIQESSCPFAEESLNLWISITKPQLCDVGGNTLQSDPQKMRSSSSSSRQPQAGGKVIISQPYKPRKSPAKVVVTQPASIVQWAPPKTPPASAPLAIKRDPIALQLLADKVDCRDRLELLSVPPDFGTKCATYTCHPEWEGTVDPSGNFLAVMRQQLLRGFLRTAGSTLSVELNASDTQDVMHCIFPVRSVGVTTSFVPIESDNVACFPYINPSGSISYPFTPTTTIANGDMSFKFVAPGALAHALTFTVRTYRADGSLLGGNAVEMGADNSVTVSVVGPLTGGTSYSVGISISNTDASSFFYVRSSLYVNNGPKTITFPNVMGTCIVSNLGTLPSALNTEACVISQNLWFSMNADFSHNGGYIAAARCCPGLTVPAGSTLFDTITSLPFFEYDGPAKNGAYVWNNQDSQFYRLTPVADPRIGANFLIVTGRVSDPVASTFRYKTCWGVVHSGQDKSYPYQSPCKTDNWPLVQSLVPDLPAAMCNSTHTSLLKKIVKRAGEFFTNEKTWATGAKIAAAFAPFFL